MQSQDSSSSQWTPLAVTGLLLQAMDVLTDLSQHRHALSMEALQGSKLSLSFGKQDELKLRRRNGGAIAQN